MPLLIDRLLRSLNEIEGIRARGHHPACEAEATEPRVEVRIFEKKILLKVVRTSGMLRDTREAVYRSATLKHATIAEPQLFIASENLVPSAKIFLRSARVGYFDVGGSLHLPNEGAYLLIDQPPGRRASQASGALYSGRRGQVSRAVWGMGFKWFGVSEAAERSGVSVSTAHLAIDDLEARRFLETRGRGPKKQRRLSDAQGLLEEWSEHQRALDEPKYCFRLGGEDPLAQLRRLDEAARDHATRYLLTATTSAYLRGLKASLPSVLDCRLTLCEMDAVLTCLGATRVDDGNFRVTAIDDLSKLGLGERKSDLWLADPLQTYLDLLTTDPVDRALVRHARSTLLAEGSDGP
jgi:hypothetical protein